LSTRSYDSHVAPYAGAWIEIFGIRNNVIIFNCRSLRGSVD